MHAGARTSERERARERERERERELVECAKPRTVCTVAYESEGALVEYADYALGTTLELSTSAWQKTVRPSIGSVFHVTCDAVLVADWPAAAATTA